MPRIDELFRDCHLLFGRDILVDLRFLETLEMSVLKTAFRHRALITHPDLFSDQGQAVQKHHAEMFIGASEAYKRLAQFVALRSSHPRHSDSQRFSAPRSAQAPPRSSSAWRPSEGGANAGREPFSRSSTGHGNFTGSRNYAPRRAPCWPLRTGEFLYYSRVIPWKQLISAIIWQRQQRERIGEIAQRWGWFSEDEILELVPRKFLGEKLGEVLLRHKWITPFQLSMLLWRQRKSQQPIGRFFVGQGLITEIRLRKCLADLEAHNRKCQPRIVADPLSFDSQTGAYWNTRAN